MNKDRTALSASSPQNTGETICWHELSFSIQAGRDLFETIAAKYPELKPYLVLCYHGTQIDIPDNPLSVLTQSPRMVADDHSKQAAIELLRRIDTVKIRFRDELERQLSALSKEFRFVSDITFEIRFERLVYESIWWMQLDSAIDKKRTPQGKASIRIVLCHLRDLPQQPIKR
ncbi:MAG: hypothetical protein WCS52_05810 [bacterium]